jgi:hypothetical protein
MTCFIHRYTYDIEIPRDADPALFEPKPLDGEVEFFEVRSLVRLIFNIYLCNIN